MTESLPLSWYPEGLILVGLGLIIGVISAIVVSRLKSARASGVPPSPEREPPEAEASHMDQLYVEDVMRGFQEAYDAEVNSQRHMIANLEGSIAALSQQVDKLRSEVSEASVLQKELIGARAARSALEAELGDERAARAEKDEQVKDHLADLLREIQELSALLGISLPADSKLAAASAGAVNGAAVNRIPSKPDSQERVLPSALAEGREVPSAITGLGTNDRTANLRTDLATLPAKTNGSNGSVDEADLAERIRILKAGIEANA